MKCRYYIRHKVQHKKWFFPLQLFVLWILFLILSLWKEILKGHFMISVRWWNTQSISVKIWYLGDNQAKWVLTQKHHIFSFQLAVIFLSKSYIMQKTPLKLDMSFQSYDLLKGCQNNRKQKDLFPFFGSYLQINIYEFRLILLDHTTYISSQPDKLNISTHNPSHFAVKIILYCCFLFFSYPVMLSIENHCCVEQQRVMAHYIKTVFGGKKQNSISVCYNFCDS